MHSDDDAAMPMHARTLRCSRSDVGVRDQREGVPLPHGDLGVGYTVHDDAHQPRPHGAGARSPR